MGIAAKRILVVDDQPMVCESIRLMLAADGHAVETALNGQAALDLFKKGRFDLTVVDYELPDMNGAELSAAIKALDPKQRILMITAYAEMLASSGKLLTGVDLVLSKPFDLLELRKAIEM